MRTVTGFEVKGGVVRARTLYAQLKDAATQLGAAKGVRGFHVRFHEGKIVETITTRKRGKYVHQEVGGSGRSWSDWVQPITSRPEAVKALRRDQKARLKRAKAEVRKWERMLAKDIK